MTKVAFHFSVPNKIAYACRLLRKATKQGAQVTVTGLPHDLSLLDDALWTFDQLEFLPHCDSNAPEMILSKTNIILADDVSKSPYSDVLVNLGVSALKGFERYLKLIELVGQEESDRAMARERWRHYNTRGYLIESYEAGKR